MAGAAKAVNPVAPAVRPVGTRAAVGGPVRPPAAAPRATGMATAGGIATAAMRAASARAPASQPIQVRSSTYVDRMGSLPRPRATRLSGGRRERKEAQGVARRPGALGRGKGGRGYSGAARVLRSGNETRREATPEDRGEEGRTKTEEDTFKPQQLNGITSFL